MNAETVATFEGIEIDQMYREHILDHYKNPRNYGALENARHIHDLNPLCGDVVDLYVDIHDDIITAAKFTGDGCAISKASSSLFTGHIKGKNVRDIVTMSREDMQELLGITPAAARVKCMMLCLSACKKLIANDASLTAITPAATIATATTAAETPAATTITPATRAAAKTPAATIVQKNNGRL
jgi:nitrogen fixation protein NifU and related proteins